MRGATILSLAGTLLVTMAGLSVSAGEASGQEALSLREEPVPSRQQTGIFPPDPPDAWRIVTQVGGTSDCIGDLVTPMCAVDTFMACFLRSDYELCAKVLESLTDYNYQGSLEKRKPLDSGKYWKYHVNRVKRFYYKIGQKPPRGEPPPRGVVIWMTEQFCSAYYSCTESDTDLYIVIKRKKNKWIVTGFDRDDWVPVPPPDPE